jgi:hypothetical protein
VSLSVLAAAAAPALTQVACSRRNIYALSERGELLTLGVGGGESGGDGGGAGGMQAVGWGAGGGAEKLVKIAAGAMLTGSFPRQRVFGGRIDEACMRNGHTVGGR